MNVCVYLYVEVTTLTRVIVRNALHRVAMFSTVQNAGKVRGGGGKHGDVLRVKPSTDSGDVDVAAKEHASCPEQFCRITCTVGTELFKKGSLLGHRLNSSEKSVDSFTHCSPQCGRDVPSSPVDRQAFDVQLFFQRF